MTRDENQIDYVKTMLLFIYIKSTCIYYDRQTDSRLLLQLNRIYTKVVKVFCFRSFSFLFFHGKLATKSSLQNKKNNANFFSIVILITDF